jgi:DNA topoisomerase-6 subunit B
MAAKKTGMRRGGVETAESMARSQREISVSEFFLKNRHLLGFDSPRKALVTAVKEAVDNSLDACEEAGIVPELAVEIEQTSDSRFRVSVTDNGPGILKSQIPKIFGKLLYGSKFHRLRMARGQQGIGISAAGMYGQLTTGGATRIWSKIKGRKEAHRLEVHLDTRSNKPALLKDEGVTWSPVFYPHAADGAPLKPVSYPHGTCVSIEMEGAFVRGRLSVEAFLKQCAVVNPHLELHYRVRLLKDQTNDTAEEAEPPWTTFARAGTELPAPTVEIKPHPHGVELGLLMQMLKDSKARTLRSALASDFSRVSPRAADEICARAGLDPRARPARIAHRESEALYKAIGETRLMRPPTDCLSPIGEAQILAGLKKEIAADFYTAVTRPPAVYRGNPFQVEVGLAYARPGENDDLAADDPVRLMRFANRVPLLYIAGACAMSKAVSGVNWKAYGLAQPRGALPVGPMVLMVHLASVWVPFTSESKEAIAHYPEILKELTFALQEGGRRVSVYLRRRKRAAEAERKRSYIEMYIPHLALGLKEILALTDRQEGRLVNELSGMLERSRLER